MEHVPVAISIISLGVAATALFMSQLRKPNLAVHVGPNVKLYYPNDGGFAVYIPTTFINDSPRMGTVFRAAISLTRTDNPQQRFFIEWGSFSTYDPATQIWRFEAMAHALAVPGKAAVNKVIWFNWLPSSNPALRVREGEYTLSLHYWTARSGKPVNDVHTLNISEEDSSRLEGYHSSGKATTLDFVLDRQLDRNRVMTPNEGTALLGV
jgi:hypothetical protein